MGAAADRLVDKATPGRDKDPSEMTDDELMAAHSKATVGLIDGKENPDVARKRRNEIEDEILRRRDRR